jgi:hypothetical protein
MRPRAACPSLAVALLLALPAQASSAVPPTFPAAAGYVKALDQARAGGAVNVEELFTLAVAAGREIEADLSRVDEARAAGREAKPAITSLDGLSISFEEAIYAEPDPRFFAPIAARAGRPADRGFFELLAATRPSGVWPAYVAQQTDVTGCIRFDLAELPSLYRRWLDFQARFPGSYPEQVGKELRDLDQALLGTCACGDQAAVVAGLEAVAKAVPKAPIAERIRRRLGEIRAGASGIRFRCVSG